MTDDQEARSAAARLLSGLRKAKRGGRKKKLRRCPLCKARFGCREMKAHLPECKREQKRRVRLERALASLYAAAARAEPKGEEQE